MNKILNIYKYKSYNYLSKLLTLTTISKRFYAKGDKDLIKHAASLIPKSPGVIPNLHQPNENSNNKPEAKTKAESGEKKDNPIPNTTNPDINNKPIIPTNTGECAIDGNKAWTKSTTVTTTTNSTAPVVTNYGAGAGITAALATMEAKKKFKETVDDFVGIPVNPIEAISPLIIKPDIPEILPMILGENDLGNLFTIPLPPPPPLFPLSKVTLISDSVEPINFALEIEKKTSEITARTQFVMEKLKALEERKLLNIEESKVTKLFYKYCIPTLSENDQNMINISTMSEEMFLQNSNLNIGLLQIKNDNDTVLLSGLQMHASLVYTIQDGKKIVWAYLTSEKENTHIILSADGYHPNKDNKPQLMRIIKPFIISNSDLGSLEGNESIQKQAESYIQRESIAIILKKEFITKVLPELQKPLPIYDGKGFTIDDINKVLEKFDKDKKQTAETYFLKYKQIKAQYMEQKLIQWLENIEKTDEFAYKFLKILIENDKK